MKTLQTLQNEFGFNSLVECMLWADANETEGCDIEFDSDSVHESAIRVLVEKYSQFLDTADTILPPDFIIDWEQVGHDFWLTCKGHGAGFWDRPELKHCNIGNQLTTICESLYLGDVYEHNGGIYLG